MAKYPYIADKRMYAAVMGACKWIRESGYFNKAVRYYANKYNVSEKELAAEIRKRQGAGQKAKGTTAREYKYYTVILYTETDRECWKTGEKVQRATSEKNARKANYENVYLDGYHELMHGSFILNEYETKAEAEQNLGNDVKEFMEENHQRFW